MKTASPRLRPFAALFAGTALGLSAMSLQAQQTAPPLPAIDPIVDLLPAAPRVVRLGPIMLGGPFHFPAMSRTFSQALDMFSSRNGVENDDPIYDASLSLPFGKVEYDGFILHHRHPTIKNNVLRHLFVTAGTISSHAMDDKFFVEQRNLRQMFPGDGPAHPNGLIEHLLNPYIAIDHNKGVAFTIGWKFNRGPKP